MSCEAGIRVDEIDFEDLIQYCEEEDADRDPSTSFVIGMKKCDGAACEICLS
jgi:hypothetical protein